MAACDWSAKAVWDRPSSTSGRCCAGPDRHCRPLVPAGRGRPYQHGAAGFGAGGSGGQADGAEGHLLRPLHYGGFPQILSRLGPAGTPLPQVDHLLLQPGRRGADPHGILPPFAGELRPQAAGVQHFQRRGYRVLRAGSHPAGVLPPPLGPPGRGAGGDFRGSHHCPEGAAGISGAGPGGCRRPVSSGSAGRIPI